MKILVVEDEKDMNRIIKKELESEGYLVDVCYDGESAYDFLTMEEYDGAILDVILPIMNGFEVLKKARSKGIQTPVLFLSARSHIDDIVEGLDIGADDYVVKPFSPSEVMARLRAVLRRMDAAESGLAFAVSKSSLCISLERYQVTLDGREIHLTKKEIEILWLLSSHAGTVFTRNHILDSVWGYDYYGDDRTVDTHIKRLRAKLDAYSHPDWEIVTVRGVGYKFEAGYE